MSTSIAPHSAFHVPRSRAAFTLVELLTVVFIISLLIAILVPSLTAARTAAKKAVSTKALESIDVGLEMFKNDQYADFPQSNGYPPSFAHPPIKGVEFNAHLGEFPFWEGNPQVYGAHWLPAMLMGVDTLGYISRRVVPARDNLHTEPEKWYTPDPLGDGTVLERSPLYVDPGNLPTLRTKQLPGRPNLALFEDWSDENEFGTQNLPVIVDGFDYPLLYYVASRHGRPSNMLEDDHRTDNDYDGGDQQRGVPYYFHQDNEAFTGNAADGSPDSDPGAGWDFNGLHPIARSGADLTAADLILDENRETFARYIVGRKILKNLEEQENVSPATQLRPVNADSYLLISPGADGRYGTNDDISNLPAFED